MEVDLLLGILVSLKGTPLPRCHSGTKARQWVDWYHILRGSTKELLCRWCIVRGHELTSHVQFCAHPHSTNDLLHRLNCDLHLTSIVCQNPREVLTWVNYSGELKLSLQASDLNCARQSIWRGRSSCPMTFQHGMLWLR
jgi:hypothetical protein